MRLIVNNWRSLLTALAIATTFVFAITTISYESAVKNLSSMNLLDIGVLVILVTASRFLQALSLREAMLLVGENLSTINALEVTGIKALFNLIFSGVGLAMQYLALKKIGETPLTKFTAVTALQAAMMVVVIGVFVTCAASVLATGDPLVAYAPVAAGLALVIVPLAIIIFWNVLIGHRLGVELETNRNIGRFRSDFDSKASKRLKMGILSGLFVTIFFFVSLRLMRIIYIALVLESSVSWTALIAGSLAGELVTVAPVTPGGIGVRELVLGLVGKASGSVEVLFIAGVVDRLIDVLVSVIYGSTVLAWYRWRYSRSSPRN